MLPLANRRILITRAAGQASALATQLEALGATTIQIPTIELVPPTSYAALDAALTSLHTFDWLIFTSPNAVRAFVTRATENGLKPKPNRIAAIGLATAREVKQSGLAAQIDLMPLIATGEHLAEVLKQHASGSSMLLVRAAAARDVLPETLTLCGAAVTIAEAYETIVPKDSVDRLWEMFMDAPPHVITFTSASTAQNLMAILNAGTLYIPRGTVLASIGPLTSQAMRELGLEPTCEAREATIPALVQALLAVWKDQ